MKMCLFHDLTEARASDLNYIHQKYTSSNEHKAISDLADTLSFVRDILDCLKEMSELKTTEAKLVKDADRLEWILSLHEEVYTGNARAKTWIPLAVKRLETKEAKKLPKSVLDTNSDDWWFSDKMMSGGF